MSSVTAGALCSMCTSHGSYFTQAGGSAEPETRTNSSSESRERPRLVADGCNVLGMHRLSPRSLRDSAFTARAQGMRVPISCSIARCATPARRAGSCIAMT